MSIKEKGFNPDKKILNLKSEEYPKSFPTHKEIEELPQKKIFIMAQDGNYRQSVGPDRDMLERETVGNVILNCLAMYVSRDKTDGFRVNAIAKDVIDCVGKKKNVVFGDSMLEFLLAVLDDSMIRKDIRIVDGKKSELITGLYAGWVIAQVKKELGVEEEG